MARKTCSTAASAAPTPEDSAAVKAFVRGLALTALLEHASNQALRSRELDDGTHQVMQHLTRCPSVVSVMAETGYDEEFVLGSLARLAQWGIAGGAR